MARILDAERIKRKIGIEFHKLREEYPDNTILNKLSDAEREILSEIDKNVKIIIIDGIMRQQFLYLIAGNLVESDERKLWYLYHAITSIIPLDEIDKLLRERYQEEYAEMLDRLWKYGTLIRKIKIYLDKTEKKTLDNNDIRSEAFTKCMEHISKLPMIYYELYHILIVICYNSTLGKNTVSSSAIQMMERELKKITYEEERKQITTTEDMEEL